MTYSVYGTREESSRGESCSSIKRKTTLAPFAPLPKRHSLQTGRGYEFRIVIEAEYTEHRDSTEGKSPVLL